MFVAACISLVLPSISFMFCTISAYSKWENLAHEDRLQAVVDENERMLVLAY